VVVWIVNPHHGAVAEVVRHGAGAAEDVGGTIFNGATGIHVPRDVFIHGFEIGMNTGCCERERCAQSESVEVGNLAGVHAATLAGSADGGYSSLEGEGSGSD
jgi:hypothetical protein